MGQVKNICGIKLGGIKKKIKNILFWILRSTFTLVSLRNYSVIIKKIWIVTIWILSLFLTNKKLSYLFKRTPLHDAIILCRMQLFHKIIGYSPLDFQVYIARYKMLFPKLWHIKHHKILNMHHTILHMTVYLTRYTCRTLSIILYRYYMNFKCKSTLTFKGRLKWNFLSIILI